MVSFLGWEIQKLHLEDLNKPVLEYSGFQVLGTCDPDQCQEIQVTISSFSIDTNQSLSQKFSVSSR